MKPCETGTKRGRVMVRRIRVLVVDDVPVQRLVMRRLVEAHPSLEWIGEADGAEPALVLIETHKPDALLLDVQMPGLSGLDRSLIINLDRVSKVERLSRNEAHLWMRGLAEPVEIGRTAIARLQEITKKEVI